MRFVAACRSTLAAGWHFDLMFAVPEPGLVAEKAHLVAAAVGIQQVPGVN